MNIKIAIWHDRRQICMVSKTVRYLCMLSGMEDHPAVKNVELALVELLTNIIDHGDAGEDSEISIHCLYSDELFTIDVTDGGCPLSSEQALAYTNDQVTMPDFESSIDALPESGWGIQLIKSTCDQVVYQREGQRNKYQLSFDLSVAACD